MVVSDDDGDVVVEVALGESVGCTTVAINGYLRTRDDENGELGRERGGRMTRATANSLLRGWGLI